MPKLKTHKATKKVLTERKNDYKIGHPSTRHNTGKKNAASNRQKRTASSLHKSDHKRVKAII